MSYGEKSCDLCGLDCGRKPLLHRFDDAERAFCCVGCMNVYEILLESGVIASGQNIRETDLFKRSLELGLISNRNRKESSTSQFVIPPDTPSQEALFQISTMWCSSCAWLIEHVLAGERGVVSAEAFFASDLLKVKYCPQYLPPDRIIQRLNSLGYQAGPYTGESNTANKEKRDLLLRLGVASFLWMNIMTLSVVLYVGYFEEIAGSVRRFLPLVLMVLATPIVFYSAQPILRLAYQGLLNRIIRMETLLTLGIFAAYFYSSVQAFVGGSEVYFDTASAIVTLVLAGKLIERSAKEKTARSITLLYRMMPRKVRLWQEGRERFVSIEALEKGKVFVVKAGERIPADGVVIQGQTHTDESLLTGESSPIAKEPGSLVVSGSINTGGVIHVRATKVGNDSTLAQIIRLAEQALGNRSSIERAVDRISRIFVPSVMALAVLTFALLWTMGTTGAGDALMRAITVLVIACPCALGMATPLAITAAVGAASRQGILVNDSRVLETMTKLDVVLLDKTGTVTTGQFSLLDFEIFPAAAFVSTRSGVVNPSLRSAPGAEQSRAHFRNIHLPLLASLEHYSEHPLGRALIEHAAQEGIELYDASEVEIRKGHGIVGHVAGHHVFIGNRSLVQDEATISTNIFENQTSEWERAGHTVAFFGWDGELKGTLAFGDRIKPEAARVIEELKGRGVKVVLVSGDSHTTTETVASAVEADGFIAEALPSRKVEVIQNFQQSGSVVAMIGDGINDAPALAQAELGIALGSGADIAMKSAAMTLAGNSLCKILDAFALSRRTRRVVRQNLFWAFLYNTLGISLAVAGILNPIIASGAMLSSSLSVIGNSLRLSADQRAVPRR